MMRAGRVAAALFSFIPSFENLELTLLLVGPGRTTLPIAILQYLEFKVDPTIAAVSFIQICLLYASDAADARPSVDLAGRPYLKKKINGRT